MDKSKALIVSLAFAAGAGSATILAQPNAPEREIVNMKVVKSVMPDGGAHWFGRACAYVKIDKGLDERCWDANEIPPASIGPLEHVFLEVP